MFISSPEFKNNQEIPKKFTCDGQNVSPPLEFNDIPMGVKSLVLIVDDPDAPSGVWVHWTLWNIATSIKKIEEASTPKDAICGTTSSGETGYHGPCPPSGTHRYFFKIYALDKTLDLSEDAGINELKNAMSGHVIEYAELIGLYSR